MGNINVELTAEQWKSVRVALLLAEERARRLGDVDRADIYDFVHRVVCDQTHPKQLRELK